MRVSFVLSASFVLIARASGAARPAGVRGREEHSTLANEQVFFYNYVYSGDSVLRDFGKEEYERTDPNVPFAISTQADPHMIWSTIYELPSEGTTLPEYLLTATGEPRFPFSAILRYNLDSPTDIQRVREWIDKNSDFCQHIFVVRYPIPITSPEAKIALDNLLISFLKSENKVEVFSPEVNDPNADEEDQGLMELLKLFNKHEAPHKIVIPPHAQPEVGYLGALYAPWRYLLDMFL